MKTNFFKDNISIQLKGETCSCTHRNLYIVVDNFVLLGVLDGSTCFFRRYFQHVLCIVDDTRASLHENQGVASVDFVFLVYQKNNVPVLSPSSPFCRCSFTGMVFQGKCVMLSHLLFCPSMFQPNLRDIFHPYTIFPEMFGTDLFLHFLLSSAYRVPHGTLFDAMMDHA